jgi:hypothetical protein
MENEFNNFRKTKFAYKENEYELGISLYSKLIFVIISENCKMGNFWIGEIEGEDINDGEDFTEIKCLLGDRTNEMNSFFANFLISYLLTSFKESKFSKIQKVLLSAPIKLNNYSNNDGVLSPELKEFLEVIKKNILLLLNI